MPQMMTRSPMSGVCPQSEASATKRRGDWSLSGLRKFRIFESSDVDETRERISSIMQPHALHPSGDFRNHRATMEYVTLGSLGIGAIRFGGMHVHVREIADYHLLVFCSRGTARLNMPEGETILNGTRGVCIAPGERLQGEFSPDCEQLILRIDASAMGPLLSGSGNRLSRHVDLSLSESQSWLGLLLLLTGSPAMLDEIVGRPSLSHHYERLILELLTAAQSAGAGSDPLAPRSVRRAEEYMRSHLGETITLLQLAEAAGAPKRTLISNFNNFRGRSPMRVLRDMRLDEARHRLLAGDGRKITAIAHEIGFSHLGRFAQEYRQRFGDAPSRTTTSPIARHSPEFKLA